MPERGAGSKAKPPDKEDGVLAAAGSFTGLWALTWLGSAATGAAVAVQGGFAVGGVMAASGLTVLWWKTRALASLAPEAAAEPIDEDGHSRHRRRRASDGN